MRFQEYTSSFESKNPGTAAALSVVPGLGHLYNGQWRKGVLFLDAAAANLILLWIIFFTGPIVESLRKISSAFHLQVNKGLLHALQQAQLGSPLSLICIGLILSFVAYAARDAYDSALRARKRRSIYPDFVMELPEAASGSYLFHFAVMAACCILACFFLLPQEPVAQVTDIEFIEEPQQKMQDKHSKFITNSKVTSGHRDPSRPTSAAGGAKGSKSEPPARMAAAPAQQPPQAQPAESHTPSPPRPVPRVQPAAPQVAMAPPMVLPHLPQPPNVMPKQPMPTATNTMQTPVMPAAPRPIVSQPGSSQAPMPALLQTHSAAVPAVMMPGASAGSKAAYTGPAPAAMAPRNLTGPATGAPAVVPISGSHSASTPGMTGAPAPSRLSDSGATGSGKSGPALAVLPAGHGNPMEAHGPGGPGANPNPISDAPGRPMAPPGANVDYGRYMAELQRRIKRNWFPPKVPQSERVIVIFKISRDGELLALRLDKSSGTAISDQAALKAVQNAAPFAPLPAGADDQIDVQFTFDYNLFGGSGSFGTYRRF